MLLYASKTQEIMFSTQRDKPDTPMTVLNGQSITICDKVNYLGVLVEHKLRFGNTCKLLSLRLNNACILPEILCT